jgi:hypothetical protein
MRMTKPLCIALLAAVSMLAAAKDAPKIPADLAARVHAYDDAQIH